MPQLYINLRNSAVICFFYKHILDGTCYGCLKPITYIMFSQCVLALFAGATQIFLIYVIARYFVFFRRHVLWVCTSNHYVLLFFFEYSITFTPLITV